jgi:hypothetical protein
MVASSARSQKTWAIDGPTSSDSTLSDRRQLGEIAKDSQQSQRHKRHSRRTRSNGIDGTSTFAMGLAKPNGKGNGVATMSATSNRGCSSTTRFRTPGQKQTLTGSPGGSTDGLSPFRAVRPRGAHFRQQLPVEPRQFPFELRRTGDTAAQPASDEATHRVCPPFENSAQHQRGGKTSVMATNRTAKVLTRRMCVAITASLGEYQPRNQI